MFLCVLAVQCQDFGHVYDETSVGPCQHPQYSGALRERLCVACSCSVSLSFFAFLWARVETSFSRHLLEKELLPKMSRKPSAII